ncbi:MAG: tetratricopeptide repeat protein [Candidatus Polarisedimenticolia bacterium]
MSKEQVRFLVSGVLFGFLVGYVIAYAVHEPRVVAEAAPVPAAGNLGMGGGPGDGGGAPPAGLPDGHPPMGGAGNEEQMTRIFERLNELKARIEKEPKDAAALVELAGLYHQAAKYDQAIDLYRRALEVRPADVENRTHLGVCLREVGKSDEAIAQFRTALSYDAKHWPTWLNLGVVALLDKNDVEEARRAFAKVEELNPSFEDLPMLKEELRKRATPKSS